LEVAEVEGKLMGHPKKISDKVLKKELLENGLTYSEICERHGYSDTSHVSRRVQKLDVDLERNSELAFVDRGGANIYFGESLINRLLELNNLERDTDVFVEKSVNDDGDLVMSVTGSRWKEVPSP
jgi:hypothetical protein